MDIRSLYGPVHLHDTAVAGEHCVFGYPKEKRIRGEQQSPGSVLVGALVTIGARSLVGNHVVLHEGVSIGEDCVLDDRVRVGYDSTIGDRSRIVYGAYVCDRVTIGQDACVAGFVCDGTRVGDRSTVMGELVHEYSQPHKGWWEVDEEPPTVEADSVVGYGARVVGAVRIGPRSYIAAGAVVTKDVPAEHVVTGINTCIPADRWTGRKLQDLLHHWKPS